MSNTQALSEVSVTQGQKVNISDYQMLIIYSILLSSYTAIMSGKIQDRFAPAFRNFIYTVY